MTGFNLGDIVDHSLGRARVIGIDYEDNNMYVIQPLNPRDGWCWELPYYSENDLNEGCPNEDRIARRYWYDIWHSSHNKNCKGWHAHINELTLVSRYVTSLEYELKDCIRTGEPRIIPNFKELVDNYEIGRN